MDDAGRAQEIVPTGSYTTLYHDVSLKNQGFENLVARWKSLEKKIADDQASLEAYVKNTNANIEATEMEVNRLRTEIGKRLGFVKETAVPTISRGPNKVKRVNNRREQILEVVKSYGPLSVAEIARHLEVNYYTITSSIAKLVKSGILEKKNKLIDIAQ